MWLIFNMNHIINFEPFWCHSCRNQQLLNVNQPDLCCVRCNSDLIEEIESFDSLPPSLSHKAWSPVRAAAALLARV